MILKCDVVTRLMLIVEMKSPASQRTGRNLIKYHLTLLYKAMELLLVFGLDVLAEVTRIAECLVAMSTLVRPFTTMDSFDMLLEKLAKQTRRAKSLKQHSLL